MTEKEKTEKQVNQFIKDLDELGIEYTKAGEVNPLFLTLNLGNKNRNNVIVTNTDSIFIHIVMLNCSLHFFVSQIFDTKNMKRPDALESINKLNNELTAKEKFFIDEDGFVCMKFTMHIPPGEYSLSDIKSYRNLLLETDFIKENFS